jgi:hypothetical protein
MNLSDATGLQRTVPKIEILEYGFRKLECMTAFFSEGKGKWECISGGDVIIIIYERFTLYVNKGETEFDAKYGEMMAVGGVRDGSVPNTSEIVNFFSYKIQEDQILEFFV